MSVYNYKAKTIQGDEKSLADYNGKVLLIVNTASECGFTPQFQELQELYKNTIQKGWKFLASLAINLVNRIRSRYTNCPIL